MNINELLKNYNKYKKAIKCTKVYIIAKVNISYSIYRSGFSILYAEVIYVFLSYLRSESSVTE